MNTLAELDRRYVWHPFTQMKEWMQSEPIVIVAGQGSVLVDANGREYLDANASIWTNLHGHNVPELNDAIVAQLGKIAHSSALGFANEPASLFAAEVVSAANPPGLNRRLERVFYSDDGSTALEVALKLAYQFSIRTRGDAAPRFLALEGAYHGDTIGAVSLGHIDLFHASYKGLLFQSDAVMAPYCYRCPFNRATPERGDARTYRQCQWECVGKVEEAFEARAKAKARYAAFVVEPLMQGAAGMIPQPSGWLSRVTTIARAHGAQIIADEVMTGFGRTGWGSSDTFQHGRASTPALFACHQEQVQPDYLCVAKGMTGGYLPMAATLTTAEVFDAFLGDYRDFKTFFHGHSFTGNQLGAAASLASLRLLQREATTKARVTLESVFSDGLESLWSLKHVGDIRRVGLVAGIELVKDWTTREPYRLEERAGIRVCEAMARRGVLTRPIGSVIVLMPPYCTTAAQVRRMVEALAEAIEEVLGEA